MRTTVKFTRTDEYHAGGRHAIQAHGIEVLSPSTRNTVELRGISSRGVSPLVLMSIPSGDIPAVIDALTDALRV